MITLPPKDPREVIPLTVDFSRLGITPLAPVVTVTHERGTTDNSPSSMLSGSPVVTGNTVVQRIQGGTIGAVYKIVCRVNASGGEHYVEGGFLPVRDVEDID